MVAALVGIAVSSDGWSSVAAQGVPVVSSAPPPAGVVGRGYLHQFSVSPQSSDTIFSVTAGSLPQGIVLSPVGFLTGAPTAAGVFGPTTVCGRGLLAPPACQTFSILIGRQTPGVLAEPSNGGPVGTPVHETASVVGGFLPTGSVTFRLFADPGCRVEVFSSTNGLTAGGSARSDDFTPTMPGTYRWTATYAGDANNEPAASGCHAANSVTLTGPPPEAPAPPTTTTTSAPPTTTTTSAALTTTTTSTPPTTTTTSTPLTTTTSAPPTTTTTTTAPPTTTTAPLTTTTTTTPPTTTTTTTAPGGLFRPAGGLVQGLLEMLGSGRPDR